MKVIIQKLSFISYNRERELGYKQYTLIYCYYGEGWFSMGNKNCYY